MPNFDPPATLEPTAFTLHLNENKSAQQASETYTVRAAEGAILGGKGETLAFAKPRFNPAEYAPNEQLQKDLQGQVAGLQGGSEVCQEWRNLKADIESLPDRTARAEAEVGRTREYLAGVELNGSEEDKQKWRNNLAGDEEALAEVQAEAAQLPQRQQRLDELAQHPDVIELQQAQAELDKVSDKLRTLHSTANASSALFNDAATMGEPHVGDDRALLTRAVASYQVDQLLGTNVIAEEKVAEAPDGRLMGVSVQVDGAQIVGKHQEKDCFLQADYSDPRIQKGLADLEAVDYITGQIDRHNGNIFVDPSTGKVTGIDNDLAFPEKEREAMLQGDTALPVKAVAGLPRQMAQETADKILALTPERLADELKSLSNPDGTGKLSEAEIGGAVQRLQNLQNAIKDPASGLQIVQKFDDQTYAAAIKEQKEHIVAQKKADFIEMEVDLNQPDFNDVGNPLEVSNAFKTSYVGGAVAQGRAYTLLEGQVDKGVEFGLREAGTAQNKAQVHPEFAAFKRAEQTAKKAMAASPELIDNLAVRQQVTQISREMSSMQAKLDDYQKQLDKLAHPSRLEKAKAMLTRGGVDNARQHVMEKRAGVLQQMKAQEEQLNKALNKAVEPLKADLYLSARELTAVEMQARGQQHANAQNGNAVIAPQQPPSENRPRAGSVADSLRSSQKVNHGGGLEVKAEREIDNESVGKVTKLKEKFEEMAQQKAASIPGPGKKAPAPGRSVT